MSAAVWLVIPVSVLADSTSVTSGWLGCLFSVEQVEAFPFLLEGLKQARAAGRQVNSGGTREPGIVHRFWYPAL